MSDDGDEFYAETAHLERRFGARPPPGFEWQVGKTAATIQWVAYLEEVKGDSGTARDAVQGTIDALKAGTMVASQFPPNRG